MTTQTTTASLDDWGLAAPAPVEVEADDDEPEREVGVWWGNAVSAIGIAAMLLLTGLAAAVLFTSQSASTPDPAPLQRSSFTDQFGRQCTQLRAGDAVALDCDAKPLESRLGGALEGLAGQ